MLYHFLDTKNLQNIYSIFINTMSLLISKNDLCIHKLLFCDIVAFYKSYLHYSMIRLVAVLEKKLNLYLNQETLKISIA